MKSEEINGVLKADKAEQYEYFIKKIADYEEVWSLRDDEGWATLGLDGGMFLPLWAKKEFAELCIDEEWSGYRAESIDLDEFLEDWLDGLKEDGIRITVMWNNGLGIDVDWDKLRSDIETELENY